MLINTIENMLSVKQITMDKISKNDIDCINESCRAYKSVMDLIPEDLCKLFSGHIFPYLESYNELENCVNLLYLGLYKTSLTSLRSCFELGLVYIYFDRNNDSEKVIKEWIHSNEDTPFKKRIINGLMTIPNINEFFSRTKMKDRIEILYSELSNYVHTCGYKYSISKLNKANISIFNEESLKIVIDFLRETTQILVVLFLLKYPIGMHYTPIDDKYGLNTPVGTFLAPDQANLVKKIIPEEYYTDLEAICMSDQDALSLAHWINDQPDISEEEWAKQVEDQDKQMIKDFGYNKWLEFDLDSSEQEYKEKMETWAADNGYLY